MLRMTVIAVVAATAVSTFAIPTDASARGRGGSHGGFHGGSHGGFRGGFRGPSFGFYGYPYRYYDPFLAPYSCYRTVRVASRRGIRWRRIWVC